MRSACRNVGSTPSPRGLLEDGSDGTMPSSFFFFFLLAAGNNLKPAHRLASKYCATLVQVHKRASFFPPPLLRVSPSRTSPRQLLIISTHLTYISCFDDSKKKIFPHPSVSPFWYYTFHLFARMIFFFFFLMAGPNCKHPRRNYIRKHPVLNEREETGRR